ncbi:hypothetical protein BH09BAC2_BH09BAC2_10040 [soil metagenome]
MKKIIFIFLCICLFACNESKEKKVAETRKNTELLAFNLKGKVQQTDETVTTIDSMGVSKSDSMVSVTLFDSIGYQTERYTKNASGKKVSEQLFVRNPDGSFAEFKSLKNGKQGSRLVTEMKDGKYIGGKNYDSTDKQDGFFTDLVNNEYGQVNEGKQHFMDGRVKSTFSSKYQGPLYIGGSSTDSTGKTDYTGTVTLDDKGNAISETTTTMNKGVSKTETNTFKYEFDEKGNWIMRTTFNDKGKPTMITKRTISYFNN